MRVLFDQNVPRNLRRHLVDHEVKTAARMGWGVLKNGDLLNTAEDGGFHVLVTGDQSLEYQQNLHGRKIAIVVLTRNNWPLVKPHIAEIVEAVDSATLGSFRRIRCDDFHSASGHLPSV